MTSLITFATGLRARARIFRAREPDQADNFYFCCEDCGNCSRRESKLMGAIGSASRHVNEGHTPTED